jgi:hypothetical protein
MPFRWRKMSFRLGGDCGRNEGELSNSAYTFVSFSRRPYLVSPSLAKGVRRSFVQERYRLFLHEREGNLGEVAI